MLTSLILIKATLGARFKIIVVLENDKAGSKSEGVGAKCWAIHS